MGRAWIAVVIGLAGCAATEMPPIGAGSGDAATTSTSVGLNPGESMTFEVRIGGVLAGEAALAVGEVGDFEGKQAVVVKSRAATAGAAALLKHIVDEATTTIDIDSGRPLQLDTYVEQGSRTTTAHATFNGAIASVTYQRSDNPRPQSYKINFGTQTVHDTHSAMAQIRGWHGAPGATRSVFVVGGRRLWRVDVKLVGAETIGSTVGNRRAVKLEGSSFRARANFEIEANKPARTFTVWLSDDADRVPLKVVAHTELGDVTIDLTDYTRP